MYYNKNVKRAHKKVKSKNFMKTHERGFLWKN